MPSDCRTKSAVEVRVASFSLAILAAVFLSSLPACSSLPEAAHNLVDKPAPNARLTLLDGRDIPVEALQGKHAAIMFWSTWCGHSRGRIENFADLARRYQKYRSVVFLAVSIDRADHLDKLMDRIETQQLTQLVHVFSGNDVADEAFLAFEGELLPYIVVIDPRGIVRSVDTSTDSLEEYLERVFQS